MRDMPYYKFSTISNEIWVQCPKCGGRGIVTMRDGRANLVCTNCSYTHSRSLRRNNYVVHNICCRCGRHYRLEITDAKKQRQPVLWVACPHCGQLMQGRMQKISGYIYYYADIRQGRDPYLDLPLWYYASLGGRPVWAINREHLNYLLAYLGASLRERPYNYQLGQTQADLLPRFMKTAKNRQRIVKLLQNMLYK